MVFARIVALGILLVFGIAAFDTAYAVPPCCAWIGGKYVSLNTGKHPSAPLSPLLGEKRNAGQCCAEQAVQGGVAGGVQISRYRLRLRSLGVL